MHRLLITTLCCLAGATGVQAQQPPQARPLLDKAGAPLVSEPRSVPAAPEQRTRSGLYATEAQARAYEQAMPGKVISVSLGCCGQQGMEEAMLAAWYQYVVYDAPSDIPVLVRGTDLRLAANLADRLTDKGFAPVFLVTMP